MRKLAPIFVLLSMTLLNYGRVGALRQEQMPRDDVRIVTSLEEAGGRSTRHAVLVFFSLDCPVCWEELFEVRYIIEKHGLPVAFVGVSADSREDLEPFLAKHAFFYPVISDPGRELFRRFRVRLEPLVVVLDSGRMVYRDNTAEDLGSRREKLKRCLIEISAKPRS